MTTPVRLQRTRKKGSRLLSPNGLPTDFPIWRRGSCVPAAYLILKHLKRGFAVQGWIGAACADREHTWVEARWSVIDPTIRQFRWYRQQDRVERIILEKIPWWSFCERFEEAYAQPWTDRGHHYRKFSRWIDALANSESQVQP